MSRRAQVTGRSRRGVIRGVCLGVLASLALPVSSASAGRSLELGLLDFEFGGGGPIFSEAAEAGAGIVRINISWRGAVSGKPANPADPGDPAYSFTATDSAISSASANGLQVLLTVTSAPNFAEGDDRPGGVNPGTWKPRPRAYGKFAQAVARRYSGTYFALPRVKFFQAWNEGNLDVHLSPQYQGKRSFAPKHYRKMLDAFYKGVHKEQPNAKVLSTGTAPYGDPPGGSRTRPLTFLRKLLCLSGSNTPKKCKVKPKLDILAHHPINTSGGPQQSAFHPNDASTPDFKHVERLLRKAEKTGRVKPDGRRPLWATELWWESRPPDRCGVPLRRHANYIQEALYLLWRQGASAVIYLSVRDQEAAANECGRASLQTGLEFASGQRKPAFRAFRFPFVADRITPNKVRLWSRVPVAGMLRIERRRKGKWRLIAGKAVDEGSIYKRVRRVSGKPKLRARVGGEKSLTWRIK